MTGTAVAFDGQGAPLFIAVLRPGLLTFHLAPVTAPPPPPPPVDTFNLGQQEIGCLLQWEQWTFTSVRIYTRKDTYSRNFFERDRYIPNWTVAYGQMHIHNMREKKNCIAHYTFLLFRSDHDSEHRN